MTSRYNKSLRHDVILGLIAVVLGASGGGIAGNGAAESEVSSVKDRVLVLEQAQVRTLEPQVASLTTSVNTLNASIAKLNEQINSANELHRDQIARMRADIDLILGARSGNRRNN